MKPREKILNYGVWKLESWELMAIILSTGTKKMSVFQLAKKLSKVLEKKKEHITLEDLLSLPGIWKTKAFQVLSAFELAKRYYLPQEHQIQSAQDVYQELKEYSNKKQEYLLTLSLNGAWWIIQKRIITIWLLDQSLAHPREIFSGAIEDRAHSLILAHNHPSWNSSPSSADIHMTKRLSEVAEIVGIALKDHIILTKGTYFSFRENSLLS